MSSFQVKQCDEETYARVLEAFEGELPESVSFLQAPVYGRLQSTSGKAIVYLVGYANSTVVLTALGVRYQAAGGLQYLYFPYGPIVASSAPELFSTFAIEVKKIARTLGCAFVRLDNEQFFTGHVNAAPPQLARMSSLQPRNEWLLDISGDEESLWMAMHKHARYNVRLAERAQAEYKIYAPADVPLDDFYMLMQTTAKRDSFSIFDRSYYAAYLAAMRPEDGFVSFVYIDDKPAATALFIAHDAQIHYVFAGSSDDYRKIAPAYFLLWHTILAARERSCTLLNFGGVQDEVKKLHLQGVTGFKKRFGGFVLAHGLPADIVIKPLRYALLRVYKTIR